MAKFLYSRLHHKPNDKHAILVIATTTVLILFTGAYIYNFMTFSARDRVIKQYAKGIEQKRPLLIYDVMAKEYDPQSTIEEDINSLGGGKFIARSDYRADAENGLVVDTTLYIFKNFKIIKKEISLIGINDAWYLAIGELKEEFRK